MLIIKEKGNGKKKAKEGQITGKREKEVRSETEMGKINM